jgi:acyl phosphate:glycerol-3-phosphate acyltransferase
MLDVGLVVLVGYFIGSFPTAIIAGKLLQNIDIREHGSKNAGATNVFRVLGWKAGLVVMLIDMLKGFVPVFWLAGLIHGYADSLIYYQILAGLAAIIGHIWTLFAGFKGGKGVGTSAGVFLGLAPFAVIIALMVFILLVAVWRYVSLGSLLGALVFLVVLIVQKFVLAQAIPDIMIYLGLVVVALIWFAHRENIKRLIKGNENKLNFSSKKST